MDEESSVAAASGMLSEMFNFPGSNGGSGGGRESFRSNRQLLEQQHQNIPASTRSHHNSSTLHMLLPNQPTHHQQGAYNMSIIHHHQLPHQHLTWQSSSSSSDHHHHHHHEIGTVQSEQGLLSLSLSAKAEEYNIYYGANSSNQFKNDLLLANSSNHHHQFGAINILRNSRYTKPAQELLEEFCSVGRGFFKKPNTSGGDFSGGGGGGSPSTSAGAIKELPPLSASDRIEHQRRKVKLLTMLEEVDRRYNHYCEQMQMVMNSFDIIMGHGSALAYTSLAQKAMSRHFRCLKDAVTTQLKQSCEFLGDHAAGISSSSSGLTKGETPRLRLLEQSLRQQQRAFHQMGIMEQEAWRPQRGLPERSVNILRAWLFEHFLHPYPSDADKHLLARQTGLSRNQVSNWFINARVRLWKPMVEDMYQQESKEEEEELEDNEETKSKSTKSNNSESNFTTIRTTSQTPITTAQSIAVRSDINAYENDSSSSILLPYNSNATVASAADYGGSATFSPVATCQEGVGGGFNDVNVISFGTTTTTIPTGDVSLTLGLRHVGNMPTHDKDASFCFREFGSF